MINLIICVLSFTIGILLSVYDYKQIRNYNPKYKYCVLNTVLRFALFFVGGFFLAETVKWLSNIETFLF